ncbi:MAG: NADPH-dependent assimilatory sulfite reductase hemoprotein subunit [Planctomycetes bacterium]|nr:NADPH-dependent assimilatory sulfite reductase hemoprotein subunit [Planctomycetota bacterium]
MSDPKKPKKSKVEGFKESSDQLRGTIGESLQEDTPRFDESDIQLLKFHGTYQQDDREKRRALRAAGLEKAYSFMVRATIPGGILTADQYLALDRLADEYGGGSLRVTTRQSIQFHGVLKANLKQHIAAMNAALVSTLAACGDVQRNVMACPAPLKNEAHQFIRRLTREIAAELQPSTGAYHEIWLDGERHLSTQDEEPFYGENYLPRKFKTGITHAGDNSIDVYSYDCGLVAILDGTRVTGFNVLVGGGMGMTHKKADTFARIASPLGFVEPDHVLETVRTVAAIFRDHGNRADRRHARLKYLIEDWGMDRFRSEFASRVSFALRELIPTDVPGYHDYIGKHAQDDDTFFYGVFIENGRITDRDNAKLKSALREIVRTHKPGIVLTPNQNVLLTDLRESSIEGVERLLQEHGVEHTQGLSNARRLSMACPALPTCGLAITEAERFMPSVLDRMEIELANLNLQDEPITIRMTGCPNGCARPYTADIAFVGRTPGAYHIFVGGDRSGTRLADLYAADIPENDLVDTLRPLLASWSKNRKPKQGFGDFYQQQIGRNNPRQTVTGAEQPTQALVPLEVKL